jgi:hypothetical protein
MWLLGRLCPDHKSAGHCGFRTLEPEIGHSKAVRKRIDNTTRMITWNKIIEEHWEYCSLM